MFTTRTLKLVPLQAAEVGVVGEMQLQGRVFVDLSAGGAINKVRRDPEGL